MEDGATGPSGDHPPPSGPSFRQFARFELVDPDRHRRRFSVFIWQPSRWGGEALLAHWGRLGQRPRGGRAAGGFLAVERGAVGRRAAAGRRRV